MPGITALDRDSAILNFPLSRDSLFVLNQCKNFLTYIYRRENNKSDEYKPILASGRSCQLEFPAFLLVLLLAEAIEPP